MPLGVTVSESPLVTVWLPPPTHTHTTWSPRFTLTILGEKNRPEPALMRTCPGRAGITPTVASRIATAALRVARRSTPPTRRAGLARTPPSTCRLLAGEEIAGTGDRAPVTGFVLEQPALAVHAAAVAGETPVGADHAVAGNHDRHRVVVIREADGAGGLGLIHLARDVAVRAGLAERNARERAPHLELELRAQHVERDLELAQCAEEVRLELLGDRLEVEQRRLPGRAGVGLGVGRDHALQAPAVHELEIPQPLC